VFNTLMQVLDNGRLTDALVIARARLSLIILNGE
jgi:ATP-dependent Clp protease ATP-binding subunit ClpA